MKSTELSRDGTNLAYAHDLVCHEYATKDVCFVSLGGLDKQYVDCLQAGNDTTTCYGAYEDNTRPDVDPAPAVGFGVVAIDVLDEWVVGGPSLVAFLLAALLCLWLPCRALTPRTAPRSSRVRARS